MITLPIWLVIICIALLAFAMYLVYTDRPAKDGEQAVESEAADER